MNPAQIQAGLRLVVALMNKTIHPNGFVNSCVDFIFKNE
jgi:hypothetical protein